MKITDVKNWCKIFTLESGEQVLATKEYDSDVEKYQIKIEARFDIEDALVTPAIKLNYSEEEKRDKIFDEIDLEMAIKSINSLRNEIVQMLEGYEG